MHSTSPYFKSTRKVILDIINQSNAAHIGASFSLVEILQAIYRSVDIDKIRNHADDRDRVILSKGHAAAALYTTLYQFALMPKETLETYNLNDSLLSGHVSHFIPCVEHSTGALGHGLPVALGMAIGLKSRGFTSKVFVIVGDGELHEGANWEAILLAGHLKMNNLYVLIDNNHLSQMGVTDKCCSLDSLNHKFESFKFKSVEVDGHDSDQMYEIIQQNKQTNSPTAIICQTTKGKGVSFMENNNLWHYRTPKDADYLKAISELNEGAL
jgi:transketolase